MLPLREQVPLAPLTTLGVGGYADLFVEIKTADLLREAMAYAKAHGLAVFILGGGSNLVVADTGFRGLVLQVNIKGVTQFLEDGQVIYEAGAGEDWDTFVAQTVAANYGGLECLSGIPGRVGGTPIQNVGAYGQEVSETIVRVTVYDRETGMIRALSNAECGFSYRASIFNSAHRDRYIVLEVAFALHHRAQPKIEYADLQRYFTGREATAQLREVREVVRQIRYTKGMLLVEGDPDAHSAGSFFKNPIVDTQRFVQLDAEMQARGLQLPSYAATEGFCKLSAAWLVEKAGFHKGYEHGNVGISSKHTLAIVNRGGAKATEVLSFMNLIRDTVHTRFGIDLQPEPVFVGFDKPLFTTR